MSKKEAKQAEDQNVDRFEEVKATLETRKAELADLQEELKEFKTENKIKSPKRIKDKDILKKYTGLTEEINVIKEDIKDLKAEAKELKPKKESGFGAKYDYKAMQVKDPQTGEMREMDKAEKKRWRTKARRIAKKEDIAPEAVEFDPNFLAPKPKKEKKAKEEDKKEAKTDKVGKKAKEEKADKVSKKKGKKKAKKSTEEDD